MCPEPGCEYVARRREEIQAHMAADHVDEEVVSAARGPMLFSCPACNCYLELENKREFQRHVDRCQVGTASGDDPNAQQRISVGSSVPSFKCKSCEFKLGNPNKFSEIRPVSNSK